jgi:uncharacterized membrane protein
MKHLVLSIALSLSFAFSFGQSVNLSGKITDEKGVSIPFASIYIKNTSKGTSANADGDYRLSLAPGKYDLVIRAMGYQQNNQRRFFCTILLCRQPHSQE